ncbi:hypothetical protein DI392_11095 [Vibrio albus]|uniref:Uncharacterized protein n=1 Tax=Vibrio albus TaxID=2200953 RepID=A0A2U3B9D5_9VIBR|nr:hypothetical protein [Vibrio albus]PWI33392.1 hypothetical protein DI392_11095 [Vibrio albus]
MIRFPFASYLFGVGLIASFQLSAAPALLDKVESLQDSVDTLQSSIDNLQSTIDSLEINGPSMVPFRTTINGGLCDSNAASDGSDDIQLRFFCRSDETDWYISRISVSGMKLEDDTISVAYGPGS